MLEQKQTSTSTHLKESEPQSQTVQCFIMLMQHTGKDFFSEHSERRLADEFLSPLLSSIPQYITLTFLLLSLMEDHLKAFVGQGSSVEGLLIGRFQFQRCITVLLGISKPLQLQVAQGSTNTQEHITCELYKVGVTYYKK